MARRMSNKDRIDRMRAEADAKKRERTKKREKSVAKSPAAAAQAGVRMKVVWAVKDSLGDVVKTFPYPQRDVAEREAERLTATENRTHIVTPHKVPME